MQCWLDSGLKADYIIKDSCRKFDRRYEKVITQIVTMIDGADK